MENQNPPPNIQVPQNPQPVVQQASPTNVVGSGLPAQNPTPPQPGDLPKKGTKLQLIAGVLIALSIFGVTPGIVYFTTKTLLGNPAANTTGRAVVNISTLAVVALGIIIGIVLAIIGTVRQVKYVKAVRGQ